MTFHRTYMDNPRLISTRTHRPPIARGHRCFMLPASGIETRSAKTVGLGPQDESPARKGTPND